ncbi:MAG: serine/threonine-protein kinase, partial [Chloroflexota bacterium]
MLIEQSVLKGRYRIAHPMEEGGYGKVYRAYDQGLKIDVAIKETLYEHADFVKGFQREAEMLAPLQHEALPKVFDTFTLADQAYIVMRYIEGENLGDYLKRQAERRVDVSTALTIVLPVLDALEYLHSQQPSPIIHRDIKPSNIRLTPDENVFLVDFGISRASDTTTSTTSTPRAMTAGFSPIEQYEQDDPVDERSDIYALGATLYYMLTGFVPHAAASRINVDPVSPLHEVENSISPRMSEVVAKMMAIRAADRYQSINEVREALTTVATPAPKIVPAPRDTAPPSW